MAFLKLLSAVRSGRADDATRAALFKRHIGANLPTGAKDLPRLYSHNADVDLVNEERLKAIPGEAQQFIMASRGSDNLIATLKRGCLSPETLSLKVGARVMFTKNNPDRSFVNGTLGEVTGFAEDGNPVVRTLRGRRIFAEPMEWSVQDGGRVLARISQLPLRLAWAITVHKSQGMTLDAAVVDLSQAFEYGQGYVALSRVRTLANLHLVGLNDRALEVHPEIAAQDREFKLGSAAARKTFESLPEREHAALAHTFIMCCGGNPKAGISPTPKSKFKKSKSAGGTLETTLALLNSGKSIADIADTRGLARTTILSHLFELYGKGKIGRAEIAPLVSPALKRALPKINKTFKEIGVERLTPVFEKLHGVYSYEDLCLARLLYEKS